MTTRYTVKKLRADLERINSDLPDGLRMVEGGRNGYQAVDLYDADGACLRNVGCGTARECSRYAYEAARGIHDNKRRELMREAASVLDGAGAADMAERLRGAL